MSKVPFDSEKALDYVLALYRTKDVPSMETYTRNSGSDDFEPVIEDEIARLFRVLVALARPKRILEIGMSIGFSTTILAKAAKQVGGRVVTIEKNAKIVDVAKSAFEREGVADVIDIIVSDAQEAVRKMASESFDIVFQDSSKKIYPIMLGECLRVLKKGGLFLVDDTLFPVIHSHEVWNASDIAIDQFNRTLLNYNVESTVLPIGEGCTVCVKL